MCLERNQAVIVQTLSVVTTDFICIRLIGNRSTQEIGLSYYSQGYTRRNTKSGRLKEIQQYKTYLQNVMVAGNNHYSDFEPETVNNFRDVGIKRSKAGAGEAKKIIELIESKISEYVP